MRRRARSSSRGHTDRSFFRSTSTDADAMPQHHTRRPSRVRSIIYLRRLKSVVSGEAQYQDDYLNDMDGRRILEEALQVAPPEERSKWLEHVRTADERIREHLVSTSECIWGEENAAKHGYSRERDWWYYHRPRSVGQGWRSF